MSKIVVAVVSAAVSLNLLASERLFAIDKAGFLTKGPTSGLKL